MAAKNYSCHPVLLDWFSVQVLVNFKLMLNLSFMHLGLKFFVMKAREFEPLNAKGKILQQYE